MLHHIEDLVQDCTNSIANALELVQSCTKPSVWWHYSLATPGWPHKVDTSLIFAALVAFQDGPVLV